MTSRSPEPGRRSRDWPRPCGRMRNGRARAERQDRDPRVVELAELAIAVPRDAVVAVSVVVQADASEDRRRSGLERALRFEQRERGMRHASRPGYQRDSRGSSTMRSYIQRLPLLPRHLLDQESSSESRAVHPFARQIDPTVIVEVDAFEPCARRRSRARPPPSSVRWWSMPTRVANIRSPRQLAASAALGHAASAERASHLCSSAR